MLAERKRKTKWIINPTKKPLWITDSNGIKFGKDLMEKMGWSAGKGLGLNEQGIQEPLKLSYKNDTKGMGFKGNDDDWIEHQDEFNEFLNQLRNDNTSSVVNISNEERVTKSLEEKSKQSRARVHYQKFTRGKDLSRYSDHDLACILGINNIKEKSKSEEGNQTKPKVIDNCETSFGVTTINGGSIQDYFKKKWIVNKKSNNSSYKFEDVAEISSESKQNTEFNIVKMEQILVSECEEEKFKEKKYNSDFEEYSHINENKSSDFDKLQNFENNVKRKKRKREFQEINLEEVKTKKRKKYPSDDESHANRNHLTDSFNYEESKSSGNEIDDYNSTKKRRKEKSQLKLDVIENDKNYDYVAENEKKRKHKMGYSSEVSLAEKLSGTNIEFTLEEEITEKRKRKKCKNGKLEVEEKTINCHDGYFEEFSLEEQFRKTSNNTNEPENALEVQLHQKKKKKKDKKEKTYEKKIEDDQQSCNRMEKSSFNKTLEKTNNGNIIVDIVDQKIVEEYESHQKKKKKKKKKDKKESCSEKENEDVQQSCNRMEKSSFNESSEKTSNDKIIDMIEQEIEEEYESHQKKKKKKDKKKRKNEEERETKNLISYTNNGVNVHVQEGIPESELVKKKKRKKKKREKAEGEFNYDHMNENSMEKKSKKTNNGNIIMDTVEQETIMEGESYEKKKKKKDKKEKSDEKEKNFLFSFQLSCTRLEKSCFSETSEKTCNGNIIVGIVDQEIVEEYESHQKKKEKKDNKEKFDEKEIEDDQQSCNSIKKSSFSETSEKTCSSNIIVDKVDQDIVEEYELHQVKKKKKDKKKRKNEEERETKNLNSCTNNGVNVHVQESTAESELVKKKKRKKEKREKIDEREKTKREFNYDHMDENSMEKTSEKTNTNNLNTDSVHTKLVKKKRHKKDEKLKSIENKEIDKEQESSTHSPVENNEKVLKHERPEKFSCEKVAKKIHLSNNKKSDTNHFRINKKVEGDTGVHKHKIELLNEKRADKFYPGRHTNERVLRLMCWSNIGGFKGSNLSNVTGYGFLS